MNLSSLRLAAVLTLLVGSCVAPLTAATITLTADDLLGTVVPGTPASAANAKEQVKFLVNAYNLGTADGTNLGNNPADSGPEVYTLYRPDGAPITLAAPGDGIKVDTSNPVVSLGGFTYQYILFFQASDAWVYYIGDIAGTDSVKWGGDPLTVPTPPNADGSQISHYVLFNKTTPTTRSVPDGGTTVLLLGAGILLTAFTVRRKNTA